MNMQHLKMLIETVKAGSISAAGRRLGKSQSTLSSAIANLEDDLGLTMFDRSGHKPRLTEEGRRLLPELIRTLDQYEHLHSVAQTLVAGTERSVRLVYDSAAPFQELVGVATEIAGRHLSTDFCFDMCFGSAEEEVLSGQADLGLVTCSRAISSELAVLLVSYSTWGYFCRHDHPLLAQGDDITTHTLGGYINILLDEVHQSSAAMLQLGKHTIRVNSPRGLLHALEAGTGFAMMPLYFVDAYRECGLVQFKLRDLTGEVKLPCGLIWSRNHARGPIVREVIDACQAVFAQSNEKSDGY